jgi:uroporphyrinogen decarboxylase
MTNRENVLKTLRKHNPQKVPFEFVLCPKYIEEFEKRTGSDDYLEYYGFPIRYVEPNTTKKKTDFSKLYKTLPANAMPIAWNPEWGVMGTPGMQASH